MPLRLPNLNSTGCINLTACGEIVTKDKRLLDWLKSQDEKPFRVAKVKIGDGAAFVRVAFGGYSKRHFHLEITPVHYFDRPHLPKSNASIAEIRSLVEKVAGEKVRLDVEGEYLVKKQDLPPMIRSTIFESKGDGVSLRMTGGTIAVDGGPIYRIKWSIGKKHDTLVSLEAIVKAVVTDSYLEDAFSLMNDAFKAFVTLENVR